MLNHISIYPTLYEQKLLELKAAQNNMYVEEFIAFVLRQALTDNSDNSLKNP